VNFFETRSSIAIGIHILRQPDAVIADFDDHTTVSKPATLYRDFNGYAARMGVLERVRNDLVSQKTDLPGLVQGDQAAGCRAMKEA
jgi:hypothetical protein